METLICPVSARRPFFIRCVCQCLCQSLSVSVSVSVSTCVSVSRVCVCVCVCFGLFIDCSIEHASMWYLPLHNPW